MYIKSLKYSALAISAVAALSMAGPAQAQTENIVITTTVSNLLTVAPTSQLNFGTIALVSHASDTGTITVSTAGAASAAATGSAGAAIVDNTGVAQGIITVEDGADGTAINVEIDNVANPNNGSGQNIVLDDFVVSWNDEPDNPFVIGVSEPLTFDSSFGGGTNTLEIGATLTSVTPALSPPAYPNGAYNGSYDVIFSY